MAVERNLLILPAKNRAPNPALSNKRFAIEQFIGRLSPPGYKKVDGKERIEIVDAVYVKKVKAERESVVSSHLVLRNPALNEANRADFFCTPQGMNEEKLKENIASYLEDPKGRIEAGKADLRHDLRELWSAMEMKSLNVFTTAAAYDFSRHDLLKGYWEIGTKTIGNENKFFDSVAYADAKGNRVYVFNLELSPLGATSRMDGGLLVVSNVSLGAKEFVETAAKRLQEVFQGIVGVWTSNQPNK